MTLTFDAAAVDPQTNQTPFDNYGALDNVATWRRIGQWRRTDRLAATPQALFPPMRRGSVASIWTNHYAIALNPVRGLAGSLLDSYRQQCPDPGSRTTKKSSLSYNLGDANTHG